MIKVHSFDVFDTLLTRPLMHPTDLFVEVARVLPLSGATPVEYAAARAAAEHAARRAGRPRDDIGFRKIFEHFGELRDWNVDPEAAMQAEMAQERRLSRPMTAPVALAKERISAGARVIFLSDMYLPTGFIHELLKAAGLDCNAEALYVSGDIGLAKYTGRLFEHVLQRERIRPAEMEHLGDNATSDVAIPRRLGIRARRFEDVDPNRHERQVYDASQSNRPERSRIAGLARAHRLGAARIVVGDAAVARVAANVIAPLLTAFVAWVLREAGAAGIERLYFVSRDGQIFLKIAEALLRGRAGPECRYLYGSRQAWFLPAVKACTDDRLAWAWEAGLPRRGLDILRRLEIDDPATVSTLRESGFDAGALERTLSGDALERFKSLLTAEPLASRILGRAAAARERLSGYLRQEGLLDSTRWALVDVGWLLKSQRALRATLRESGYAGPVEGFYLGINFPAVFDRPRTRHDDQPLAEVGAARAFVTKATSTSRVPSGLDGVLRADWFFRLDVAVLLEHLFTVADHPTTAGYEQREGRWSPVFRDEGRDATVLAFGARLQRAVIGYAEALRQDGLVDPCSDGFRRMALDAVAQFAMAPEREDVAGVAWLPTNRDPSHAREHASRLASPLGIADILSLAWYDLISRAWRRAYFSPRFTWLAGSAALSPAPVRWLFRVAFLANRGRIALRERVRSLVGGRVQPQPGHRS